MALSSVPHWTLFLALMAVALKLGAASQFRGAIIQWRPVDPDNFDGRVSNYDYNPVADLEGIQGCKGTPFCKSYVEFWASCGGHIHIRGSVCAPNFFSAFLLVVLDPPP